MTPVHQPPTLEKPESPSPPAFRGALPVAVLIGATVLLYGLGLGSLDLWAPDEPRYAAIAEELRSFRHGPDGLVLLHLNDTPYTQKPPLFFWLAALFGAPAGRVTELAARLPSALAGISAVALTAWIGRLLLGAGMPALLAGGLLATSFRFAFTARRAQLDALLTACELLAVALFLVLAAKPGGLSGARRHPLLIAGLHAALGAAGLVKGPVGWLPLAVFAAFLVWEGRGRAFFAITPAWAWMLSIGPLAAWAGAAIALAPPGFAEVAIVDNVLGRFFAGTSHARPIYYYLYQLPLNFLPWSLVLPFGLAIAWRRGRSPRAQPEGIDPIRSAARFLIVWAAVPFLFFTASAGKRALYLLPIFPALALISVLVVDRRPEVAERDRGRAIRRFTAAIAAVALIEIALLLFVFPAFNETKSLREIASVAANEVGEGERIGIFGLSPIEAALGYYEGSTIASLSDEQEVRTFLSQEGRVILLRERHFTALAPELGLEKIASFRAGDRKLSLARSVTKNPEGAKFSPH